MFENIVQKWNGLKAEWSEYKKLRQECARNWRLVESAREELTTVYDIDDAHFCKPKDIKSCIEIIFNNVSRLIRVDETDSWQPKIMETYCPSFDKGNPCANVDCPMHKANQEYVRAVKDYMDAVQRRRAYWKQNDDKTK